MALEVLDTRGVTWEGATLKLPRPTRRSCRYHARRGFNLGLDDWYAFLNANHLVFCGTRTKRQLIALLKKRKLARGMSFDAISRSSGASKSSVKRLFKGHARIQVTISVCQALAIRISVRTGSLELV